MRTLRFYTLYLGRVYLARPHPTPQRAAGAQEPSPAGGIPASDEAKPRAAPCVRADLRYSKGLSDRNRLAGGSQLISKFLREIEPTVSQFLNVHAFRK